MRNAKPKTATLTVQPLEDRTALSLASLAPTATLLAGPVFEGALGASIGIGLTYALPNQNAPALRKINAALGEIKVKLDALQSSVNGVAHTLTENTLSATVAKLNLGTVDTYWDKFVNYTQDNPGNWQVQYHAYDSAWPTTGRDQIFYGPDATGNLHFAMYNAGGQQVLRDALTTSNGVSSVTSESAHGDWNGETGDTLANDIAALKAQGSNTGRVSATPGNASFESGATGWTFTANSGVTQANTAITVGGPTTLPDGSNVAYLTGAHTANTPAKISQWVNFPVAADYAVSFSAAEAVTTWTVQNRTLGKNGKWTTTTATEQAVSNEDFSVTIDGVTVGTFQPVGTGYQAFRTNPVHLSAGDHSIEFVGRDTTPTQHRGTAARPDTVLIDKVQVESRGTLLDGTVADAGRLVSQITNYSRQQSTDIANGIVTDLTSLPTTFNAVFAGDSANTPVMVQVSKVWYDRHNNGRYVTADYTDQIKQQYDYLATERVKVVTMLTAAAAYQGGDNYSKYKLPGDDARTAAYPATTPTNYQDEARAQWTAELGSLPTNDVPKGVVIDTAHNRLWLTADAPAKSSIGDADAYKNSTNGSGTGFTWYIPSESDVRELSAEARPLFQNGSNFDDYWLTSSHHDASGNYHWYTVQVPVTNAQKHMYDAGSRGHNYDSVTSAAVVLAADVVASQYTRWVAHGTQV